jgi:hypothetical protein
MTLVDLRKPGRSLEKEHLIWLVGHDPGSERCGADPGLEQENSREEPLQREEESSPFLGMVLVQEAVFKLVREVVAGDLYPLDPFCCLARSAGDGFLSVLRE